LLELVGVSLRCKFFKFFVFSLLFYLPKTKILTNNSNTEHS